MDSNRRTYLGDKFKAAAATNNKAHVIAREGQWIIFKEGAKRATASYATQEGAINNAKKILQSREVQTLVIHRKDGSVSSIESLEEKAI